MNLPKILPALCVAAATGIAALTGGAAVAFAAGAAPQSWSAAQSQQQRQDPRYVGADGRVCEKMCPHDTLPCDPLNFKLADGRCRGGINSPR